MSENKTPAVGEFRLGTGGALETFDGERWVLEPSMVDRVAKAILFQETGVFPDKQRVLRMARAAIAAMRDPTLAMRRVSSFEAAEKDWPAMIDAALDG